MEKSTTQTATPVSLCWRWSRVTTIRYLMYVYCMFMTVCLYMDLKRLQKKISREVQKPCLQHFNLHAEFLHELAKVSECFLTRVFLGRSGELGCGISCLLRF